MIWSYRKFSTDPESHAVVKRRFTSLGIYSLTCNCFWSAELKAKDSQQSFICTEMTAHVASSALYFLS